MGSEGDKGRNVVGTVGPGEKADEPPNGPEDDGFRIPEFSHRVEKSGMKTRWAAGSDKPKPGVSPTGPKVKRSRSFGPLFKKKLFDWRAKHEGEERYRFVEPGWGHSELELLSASYDLDQRRAQLTVVDGVLEISGAHAEFDIVHHLKLLFGIRDPPPPPPPPTIAMAARVGDLTMHVAPLGPGPGSPNVLIGGMPAWRVGLDIHICPAPGATPHGTGPTSPGEATVLINGAPAARATDFIVEPGGGPDVIAVGCATVWIGKPAPAPPPSPASHAGEDLPWVKVQAVATADLGKLKVKAKVGGEVELGRKDGSTGNPEAGAAVDRPSNEGKKGTFEAGAEGEGAVLAASLPVKVRIRIPFSDRYLGIGVQVDGTFLALGAKGHSGVAINNGKKLLSATGGAKVDAGIGGIGITFSVDISK